MQKLLERGFTPDARCVQQCWPTPFMDACGQPIGSLHVLTVIARLLQGQDESGILVIGDLIIHLFRCAGESMLPILPDLGGEGKPTHQHLLHLLHRITRASHPDTRAPR
jgi:hypothetical protein